MWQRLRQIAADNPEWAQSVQRVSAAAFDGCANSTAKVYMRWIEEFSGFCEQAKVEFPDILAAEVALFLQRLSERGLGAGSLSQASAPISWATQVAGRWDPCKDKLVASIIASARRQGEEVNKMPPGTREHLLFLHQWAQKRKMFVAERTFIISLSLINACARFNDISNSRQKDVLVLPNSIQLIQHRTKMDQCGQDGIIKPMPRA